MEQLHRLHKENDISFYERRTTGDPRVIEYVVSTPETRAIVNEPGTKGELYTTKMEAALRRALEKHPERERIEKFDESDVAAITIMRGGVAYPLQRLLSQVFDWNGVGAGFLTSQRSQIGGTGDYQVIEDKYFKFEENQSILFTGDIVATWTTADGLRRKLRDNGKDVSELHFFTIGTDKTRIGSYNFLETFPECERIVITYIEGIFGLAAQDTPMKIKKPGTDLLINPGLLSPELLLSLGDSALYPIYTCRIFDGGKRLFNARKGGLYDQEVVSSLKAQRELSEDGFTLWDTIAERHPYWPFKDGYDEFSKKMRNLYPGMDDDEIDMIYRTANKDYRWRDPFLPDGLNYKSPEALKLVIDEGIRRIDEQVVIKRQQAA